MSDNKLIFVVDDDPFILNLVRKRLENKAYELETFMYGEECLGQLGRKPDLIILDYLFMKPDARVMNGMEIFEKIRETEPDIPVIMLSGQDSGNIVLELARKGIEDYVIKDNELIDNLEIAIDELFRNE